jgi:hypothetical protein
MRLLRRFRLLLIVLTGLAAGVSWGALEQSPRAQAMLAAD